MRLHGECLCPLLFNLQFILGKIIHRIYARSAQTIIETVIPCNCEVDHGSDRNFRYPSDRLAVTYLANVQIPSKHGRRRFGFLENRTEPKGNRCCPSGMSCQFITTLSGDKKRNRETCIANSFLVSEYARKFAQGHWSLLRPAVREEVVRNSRIQTKWRMRRCR